MSDQSAGVPRAAGNGHDPYAQKRFVRNVPMLTLENVGSIVAVTFVGSRTLLPAFVVRLGGSTFLVGLIAT